MKIENVKILTSQPQVFFQDIKNPLRGLIGMQKPVEFHLPHYEILQPFLAIPWPCKWINELV